jgi:hypothetical protein
MPDIFLSYAREDQVRAGAIAKALSDDGYEVFWDKEIPPGRTWADFLEEKLTNCKAVVVLWSRHSTASQWVKEEARIALDKGKLIPAMLDASAPPFGFGEVQAANLTSFAGDRTQSEWRRLTGAIQALFGEGPRPRARPAANTTAQSGWRGPEPVSTAAPAKDNGWLKWVGGAVAAVVVLGVIGSLSGGGDGPQPGPAPFGNVGPGPVPGGGGAIAPDVQTVIDQARANEAAAKAAVQAANQASAQGQQAASAAASGQAGFGVQQVPLGVAAGNLNLLASGQVAPIGLQAQNGMQFFGLMQASPSGSSLEGTFIWGAAAGAGKFRYPPDGTFEFVGTAGISGRYSLMTRELGQAGSTEGGGVGVVSYPDGRRYEGEYKTRGEGPQSQLFRHGLGVHYAANGDVMEAGRFANDRLTGAQ